MTHQEIVSALVALGFNTGWSFSGTDWDNALWLNDQPKPTLDELRAALLDLTP